MTVDGPTDQQPSRTAGLDDCAREPIHVPGSIQPQGCLFVLSPDTLTIEQAAIGPTSGLGEAAHYLGSPVQHVLPRGFERVVAQLVSGISRDGQSYLGRIARAGGSLHAFAHHAPDALILELEEAPAEDSETFGDVYPFMRTFLDAFQETDSIETLGAIAAREVCRITGFDRALVYRFDKDMNGTVIAEHRNDVLPSYLDLRFPASDIPAQARELYRLNRLRLIADAHYQPVPIVPAINPRTGRPIDLSHATLRSVSPVHLEYMRNMGTGASMSVSLLREGALWGLLSCHNQAPRRVPHQVRNACDFVGKILSLQIAAREQTALAERRIALRAVQGRLLASMATEDHFVDGLMARPQDLLDLTHSQGAAVIFGERCRLTGETPGEEAVRAIVSWLEERAIDDLFATESLAQHIPGAEAFKDQASGLVAVPISQIHASYVLWFRPEAVRTVGWGGSPVKPMDSAPAGARIHPRKSFEVWKETVRLRALPWDEAEIDAASLLRGAIVDIVLRRAEEMAELNDQLVRSNRELEAFSYSVSHDLRAPFRHIVGYAQLLKQNEGEALSERANRYIDTIIESALSAGTLVDDLLNFSQMGRSSLHPLRIDMNGLVDEVRQRLAMHIGDREIEWKIGALPPVVADPTMMRLVIQNLLDNAIKFSRHRAHAVIEVGSQPGNGETVYFVRDNGTGFDMAYVGKLFGVFQRLHRVEEFEGTGIGLANVKRIVEQRHGGRVWAEGKVDQGATIFFALPNATGG
ncbi:ATP-binding protein [Flavisphingomonas formosensis]|uniref:ATP-binding protein n=1 Tax=Flavisphingomonas formosensis TaxID=861534 RepID=UPI0012F789F3|nr:ATP-binding protein [Sphingomonas formosensis]